MHFPSGITYWQFISWDIDQSRNKGYYRRTSPLPIPRGPRSSLDVKVIVEAVGIRRDVNLVGIPFVQMVMFVCVLSQFSPSTFSFPCDLSFVLVNVLVLTLYFPLICIHILGLDAAKFYFYLSLNMLITVSGINLVEIILLIFLHIYGKEKSSLGWLTAKYCSMMSQF